MSCHYRFTFDKDVVEFGKWYVSDDDEEEESIVVSDIGEYDTEDDDNFILEQLEALRFNFDELEMLGCEKKQREDLDVA